MHGTQVIARGHLHDVRRCHLLDDRTVPTPGGNVSQVEERTEADQRQRLSRAKSLASVSSGAGNERPAADAMTKQVVHVLGPPTTRYDGYSRYGSSRVRLHESVGYSRQVLEQQGDVIKKPCRLKGYFN